MSDMSIAREALRIIGELVFLGPGEGPPDSVGIWTIPSPAGEPIVLTLGHLRAISAALGHLASDEVQPLPIDHTFHPQGPHGAGGIRDDEGHHIATVANVEQAIGYLRGLNDGFSRGQRVGAAAAQSDMRRALGCPDPDGVQGQINDLEHRLDRLEKRGEK